MALYAEIVPPEKIDHEHGVAYIDGDDADRYEPLYEIHRPANNGTNDWCERIELFYTDGTAETVNGHFLNSGDLE